MGVYIPNMEKPKRCGECDLWSNCFYPKNPYTEQDDYIAPDCELIEIAELTETLKHDIRKLIAFIEPHMIIASTYDEQIERAEEVKNWLLSIVGESNADQYTQSIESVEQEEWIDWREEQEFEDRWERRTDDNTD